MHRKQDVFGTFSVCAADLEARQVGVAVESKYFAVGNVVPWAAAGLGAIATQASGNRAFGWRAFELLEEGMSPQQIIPLLLQGDGMRDHRQVGIVDALGRVANYTGEECTEPAGAETGEGFTCQGNTLTGPEVVQEMARAMRESGGQPLAERLMRALEAGQAAGGDKRGQQSAAMLVAQEGLGMPGFDDKLIDLRVDDHDGPILELRELLEMQKAIRSI